MKSTQEYRDALLETQKRQATAMEEIVVLLRLFLIFMPIATSLAGACTR